MEAGAWKSRTRQDEDQEPESHMSSVESLCSFRSVRRLYANADGQTPSLVPGQTRTRVQHASVY